jgi:hypothetical protein
MFVFVDTTLGETPLSPKLFLRRKNPPTTETDDADLKPAFHAKDSGANQGASLEITIAAVRKLPFGLFKGILTKPLPTWGE